MPHETSRQRLSTRVHASVLGPNKRRKYWPSLVVTALGALLSFGASESSDAQRAELRISVPPTIVAQPASQASLGIEVDPPEALPKKSFVSLRGLPATVSLTDGHATGVGSWAVPVTALLALKANIPDSVMGRSEVFISLISMEGSLLAVARTALVVGPPAVLPPAQTTAAVQPPAETTPAVPPPTIPAPSPRAFSAEERDRIEKLVPQGERYLAQGERYLSEGNVAVARQFFQRAADAGYAPGAMLLAATYDPAESSRLQLQGIIPDQALARRWYERARELGAPGAAERLARLGQN
jgi:hypothetical protein